MKYRLTPLLILLTFSCTIRINENDYRDLEAKELSQIHAFDASLEPKKGRNKEKVHLYEINSPQILNLAKQEEFLWVHIWNPCCSGTQCININYFEEELNKHENKNLRLLFISESYNFRCIDSVASNASFDHPIYVLEDGYYGHKSQGIRQKLQADVTKKAFDEIEGFYSDFIFMNGELIYNDSRIKPAVLDSLANTILD